ncbi:MAG: hypothetical protein IKO61_00915 [Lachnospiraceae bacterium]|nr:hypothetical protein [Lachnospiraceae bacterium]
MTASGVKSEAELYEKLWEDWRKRTELDKLEKGCKSRNREQSIIYRMFSDIRDEKAALLALNPGEIKEQLKTKSIRDKYILLKAAHDSYFVHGLTEERDYTEVLCELIKDRNRLPKKLEKKLDDGAGAGDLEQEYSNCLSALLRGVITDTFRNKGYGIKVIDAENDEGKEVREVRPEAIKAVGRDKDSIAMLNSLREYEGEKKGEAAGRTAHNASRERAMDFRMDVFSDEFVRRISLTYRSLVKKNDTEIESVFLPLHIDAKSGAGLYIIGRKLFDDLKGGQNCYPVVRWFSDLEKKESGDVEPGGFAYHVEMTTERFTELDRALKAYRSILMSNTVYEGYKGVNGLMPAGTDWYYKDFFDEADVNAAEAVSTTVTQSEMEIMDAYEAKELKDKEKQGGGHNDKHRGTKTGHRIR